MMIVKSRIGGIHAKSAGAPDLAWMLIVALLTGALPMLTGVVVIADSKAAFTLDVCHAAPGASYNLNASLAPPIRTHFVARALAAAGYCCEFVPSFRPQLNQAPNPPPPKTAA